MSRRITPVLWSRTTKEGLKFIYVRLTENRKSIYFTINRAIPPKYWNKDYKRVSTKYPNYDEINKLIDDKIREIEKNDLEVLKGRNGSYLDYFKSKRDTLKAKNRIGTFKKYNVLCNHLEKFLSNNHKNDLQFKDVNTALLDSIDAYFIQNKISATTRRSYFKVIKRIYLQGLEDDLFITYKNPFFAFKPPKNQEPRNKALTLEEFSKVLQKYQRFLIDYLYLENNKPIFHTFNFFLFSFYAQGMRFGDLIRLKWGNFQGVGKKLTIVFTMNKTDKQMVVPLYDELIDILRFYLPLKLKLIYLAMTNRDRSLFYSLDHEYRQSLLNGEFSDKQI